MMSPTTIKTSAITAAKDSLAILRINTRGVMTMPEIIKNAPGEMLIAGLISWNALLKFSAIKLEAPDTKPSCEEY